MIFPRGTFIRTKNKLALILDVEDRHYRLRYLKSPKRPCEVGLVRNMWIGAGGWEPVVDELDELKATYL
jgi:hypothetical protein